MTPPLQNGAADLESGRRALQSGERCFRLLIEKNADGVLVIRQDGTVCFANPAAEALLQRSACRLAGEMFGVPVSPGETTEVDVPRRNGPPRVAEMHVAEIEWEGEPAYLASLRDVTERRRAAEAMRFLDEASTLLAGSLDYRRTLQTAARLAVVHLADWCFIDLLEEGPGSEATLHRIVTAHSNPDREELAALLQGRQPIDPAGPLGLPKAFRTGRPQVRLDIDEEFLRTLAPDAEQRRVLESLGCRAVMIVPLVARSRTLGAITFVAAAAARRYDAASLSLAEDLARRAAVAVDNARLYDLAQDALRRRDEFLAMLSHELRNPLAAILHSSQLLTSPTGSAAVQQRARQVVERQGRHMARLLDDLLDISRVTHDKIELRKQTVDLAALVVDVLHAAQSDLDAHGHSLTVTLPGEPVWLEADATRLGQVVSNLVSNAAKYTRPGGRLEVSLACEGPTAVLRMRDSGVGIPAEMLAKIFDLFTQVRGSLDRAEGGLGIGLTLVRRLVELHGGSVTASSGGAGRGSEFVVRLPLAAAPQPTVVVQPAAPAAPPASRRVLLVEDNADSRAMLRDLLEMWGHEVREATDGLQGLELAWAWRPHLALIDIGLPGMNGYELAETLRAEADGERPLLVALTGYGRPDDRRQALAAGFDRHLVKPVDLGELERLLAEEVGAKGM